MTYTYKNTDKKPTMRQQLLHTDKTHATQIDKNKQTNGPTNSVVVFGVAFYHEAILNILVNNEGVNVYSV